MAPFHLQPLAIKNLSTARPPKTQKMKPGNAPLCAPGEVSFPPHQSAVWELLREMSLVTSARKVIAYKPLTQFGCYTANVG